MAQATTWKGSTRRTALGHRWATTSAIRAAASAKTTVICAGPVLDKPETLSDNDVRLLKPEVHPRKCQKSHFFAGRQTAKPGPRPTSDVSAIIVDLTTAVRCGATLFGPLLNA